MPSRRTFNLALAALCLAASGAIAQPYSRVDPPQPTEGGGRIEVIEFFWYGCPHCYTLEANVVAWLKNAPKDVVFKRVPAIPSDAWAEHARIFYTIEALGKFDELHPKVFDAIHKSGVNLNNKRIREEWLAKNGVDVAKYGEAEKSFTVVTKMNRAKQLTMNYKVDSVPRVVVGGKYFISAEQAGGTERVFPVVDQIIAATRKEKAS